MPPQDQNFFSKTSLIQLGYGVWVNLTTVVIGLAFGFTAVALPQLSEPSSKIHVSVSDRSWITSVLTVLSPFGCVITGYLMDKIGRCRMLILCHLPVIIGWLYTALATSANGIIIGRVITGFGLGMIVVAPRPYLSEISLPKMRGVIGTFPNLALSIGIVIQGALGTFCRWEMLCYICMFYSLILMISNFFLPETPHYLLMTSTMDNAEASLRKFRARGYKIDEEIEELRNFKNDHNIRSLTWKEKGAAMLKPSACKPFIIILFYFIFTQTSGISVMTMSTVEIIQGSKCSVDAHIGNIILGITRFLSGVFTSIVIFRIGRRPLALACSLGVGISSAAVGPYIITTQKPTIFPLICYTFTIIFSSLGYYTLPVLIMSELYPLQVRGIMGGLSISINYFLIFAVNKIYPYMVDAFGLAITMITFGLSSLQCFVFLYFFLPETKGLTLQEIESYFKRPVNSQRILGTLSAAQSTDKQADDKKNEVVQDKKRKEEEGSTSHDLPKNKD